MSTTIIYRHHKENKKKCSLTPLEKDPRFLFLSYPKDSLPDLSNHIILTLEGKTLSLDDKNRPLLLIDATWNYASKMLNVVMQKNGKNFRSLPSYFQTAYPRKQTHCPDPKRGLASIEALYLAFLLVQKDPSFLLDHYYWKEAFLQINHLS